MSYTLVEPPRQTVSHIHEDLPERQDRNENPAFVLESKGHFRHEGRAVPTLPSDRHVIVAIKATGLCGSDVRAYTKEAQKLNR